MSQQWASLVRVCVHDADSVCLGTHQIQTQKVWCVYLHTYDLPVYTHSVPFSISQGNLGKNTQLLQACNRNPSFSKLPKMEQFSKWNWISLNKIGQQVLPQLQFWLTDLRHVEGNDIPWFVTAPIQFQVLPLFLTFLIETAALCEHPLNSAGQRHAASTKILIQAFQKHLHGTCLCFLLQSVINLPCENITRFFCWFSFLVGGFWLVVFFGFFLVINWKKS